MSDRQIVIGTIIRTFFVTIELIMLVILFITTFSIEGMSVQEHWVSIIVVLCMLSPLVIYVIASAIFNMFNMNVVLRKRHTNESIQKYYKLSKIYLTCGIIAAGLYGFLFVPFFLLENLFLVLGYKNALNSTQNR